MRTDALLGHLAARVAARVEASLRMVETTARRVAGAGQCGGDPGLSGF